MTDLLCCLFPGMLLGFGLAVYPRRELLGRGLPPGLRSLWLALPGAALRVGWPLMAATLLLLRAGELLGGPVLAWCLALDAAAAGAGLLLAAQMPIRAAARTCLLFLLAKEEKEAKRRTT